MLQYEGAITYTATEDYGAINRIMADEENVRQEVWEGRIPVCFTVADEEVIYSMSGERANPEPTYVSLPR